MPRAIAIETSGRIGSIAVVDNGIVVDEQQFEHGLKHAAQVLPMIDRMIMARGWKPADIAQLYLSVGPGSFTGLRIGVTLAKTLALATGVKVVSVPTLRVLVENAPPEAGQVIIVLDAKREQIFTARFERVGWVSTHHASTVNGGLKNGGLKPTLPSDEWIERAPARLDSLAAMLARSPRPVWLLGEGIPYHQQFIPADDASIVVTSEESWRARASVVAMLGMRLAQAGQFADPFTLTPIYIRKPEAIEKWEQANEPRRHEDPKKM